MGVGGFRWLSRDKEFRIWGGVFLSSVSRLLSLLFFLYHYLFSHPKGLIYNPLPNTRQSLTTRDWNVSPRRIPGHPVYEKKMFSWIHNKASTFGALSWRHSNWKVVWYMTCTWFLQSCPTELEQTFALLNDSYFSLPLSVCIVISSFPASASFPQPPLHLSLVVLIKDRLPWHVTTIQDQVALLLFVCSAVRLNIYLAIWELSLFWPHAISRVAGTRKQDLPVSGIEPKS